MDQMVAEPVTVSEAVGALNDALVDEVFEHADRFLRADDSVDVRAVFRWLLDVARENDGIVSTATIGTAGSKWLLARHLGDTLQDSVDLILTAVAAERALEDMTAVFLFASMMSLWRMNDKAHYDRLFSDLVRIEDISGTE